MSVRREMGDVSREYIDGMRFWRVIATYSPKSREQLLGLPISVVLTPYLSFRRTVAPLLEQGFRQLGDLTSLTGEELMQINGIGPAGVTGIERVLALLGLELARRPSVSATASLRRHAQLH